VKMILLELVILQVASDTRTRQPYYRLPCRGATDWAKLRASPRRHSKKKNSNSSGGN
jgi:hypothetical protein